MAAAPGTARPDTASIDTASTLVGVCREVVDAAGARLAQSCAVDGRIDVALLDREQVLAYDLATTAGQVTAAEHMLAYGGQGDLQALLTVVFAGHVAADLIRRIAGREHDWGADHAHHAPDGRGAKAGWRTEAFDAALQVARSPALLEAVAEQVLRDPQLPRRLDEQMQLVRETFRDFTEARVVPIAEHVHRADADIPEDLIVELAAMGCFGLSIPERHGGFAAGELLSMVVVTEELSRGSLGVAGSLITRPEIVARALLTGGTDEQKARWLPGIAAGELMCAVAVTEPDHGSDVADLQVRAVRDGDHYVVNGVKTWCTFAGRADLLLLLARTGAAQDGHRGLSLLVVEKPPAPGHAFVHVAQAGGRLDARAIPTIGYRGMHSFELSFEDFHVPARNLVGGDGGLGRGFYLQLDAFAGGRLQTAARATGVMQAAFEQAVSFAGQREVFGIALADYQLTRSKLATMAALIAACRQFSYRVAELLGAGGGQREAAMVKSLSCLAAEWLTREAQQLHGGMGYAEEYAVSRYFVDARVLSIFEGADEVLALRVVARQLLEGALAG